MTELHTLVARHLGRPVLMLPDAAQELASRIYSAEPRALRSETKFAAFLRLAGMGRPKVFDDEAYDAQSVEEEPMPAGGFAYVPLWMEQAGGPDDELEFGMSLKDGIACLNIDTAISSRGSEFCGTWYHGYDTIAAALRQAFADDRVKAIFLRFETPGGVVDDGIDEVSDILRANREKAGGKPVWGFCDVACSAGYWIASQCDRLIAPRTGIVGSIGAVMIHTEYSGMLAKDGIRVTPIQFGAQKTAGNAFQELSETAAADMQAWVDQAGRDFVSAIQLGRETLDEAKCLATEARFYTAHHDDPARSGLELGLVDEILREAAAFEALRQHTEQAAPATPAAASAGAKPASTATTGDPIMAKPKAAAPAGRKAARAAKRAAQIKAHEARIAAIRAEEEADAIGEDEEAGAEGEEEDVVAEGDEAEPGAEGDEEEVAAEGDEEEPGAEGDEEGQPAANASLRKLAIMGLPEAKGQHAYAKSLADGGLSLKAARIALRAAARTNALTANRDAPLSTRPSGGGSGKADASSQLVADLVAFTGTSRLRKQPGK